MGDIGGKRTYKRCGPLSSSGAKPVHNGWVLLFSWTVFSLSGPTLPNSGILLDKRSDMTRNCIRFQWQATF